ncbi:MAG: DUF6132 family protein [Ginsengibacter sp.]
MKNSVLYKYSLTLIGVIIATLGELYYYFVGCASGACAITPKPVNSTLYGALMGGLIFNILKNERPGLSISKKKELCEGVVPAED